MINDESDEPKIPIRGMMLRLGCFIAGRHYNCSVRDSDKLNGPSKHSMLEWNALEVMTTTQIF